MSGDTVTELQERIFSLKERRAVACRKKLSWTERFELANEIYDVLMIDWTIQTLCGPMTKGSGALTLQIERARLELEWLLPKAETEDHGKPKGLSIGFELAGLGSEAADA